MAPLGNSYKGVRWGQERLGCHSHDQQTLFDLKRPTYEPGHSKNCETPSPIVPTPPTLGLAGEGRGLFFTSIHVSESRSGKLAERPLGIVFKLLTSSVLVRTGLAGRGDPGADSRDNKSHNVL